MPITIVLRDDDEPVLLVSFPSQRVGGAIEMNENEVRIVAQAMRKTAPQGVSVCVSWWSNGRVTETTYHYLSNGMVMPDYPRDLSPTTTWNEVDFGPLVRTDDK